MKGLVIGTGLLLAGALLGTAQEGGDTGDAVQDQETPPVTRTEVVIVTPCRGCLTTVFNSPAAVSVIPSDEVVSAPDRSVPELLRAVPGVNVARSGNRDWNVTSRQATSTLANSQLVLVDGRSIYLDFMGTVLWDLMPVDPVDIEQIEVVRGPASAVWGANAFTGVVNILTRAPGANEGASTMVSFTSFNRSTGSTVGDGAGAAYAATTTMSRRISDRLAYRISGGYAASDPYPRPVGTLPLLPHPLQPETLVGGGELPLDDQEEPGDFRNRGTTQPRVDARVDQQIDNGRVVYGAGIAGTDGIVHSGIGPFNLERGTYLGYVRGAYTRGLFRAAATATLFGGKGSNLIAFGVDEEPLRLRAQTRTLALEANHSRLLGTRHLLTYGANVQRDMFGVNLAPATPDRTDVGGYVQEEFFPGFGDGAGRPEMRLAVGLRVDKFGNIEDPVLSPRVSVMWKPGPSHSLRVSVNRAFRAPSAIDNYLDVEVLTPVDLTPYFPDPPEEQKTFFEDDFLLTQRVLGNPDLKQESLTSYEIGYIGTLGGRTTVGLNLYVNDTSDNINFVSTPEEKDPYTAADPPPKWELPPSYLTDLTHLDPPVYFPRVRNQFQNLGPIRHRGVELFVEHRFAEGLTGYVNYSWQPDPRPRPAAVPFPALEITIPPRNRVNAGVYWVRPRWSGSLSLNQADRAFWVDVLPHDFDGETLAYTSFNASLGVRFAGGRMGATLRGTDLTNADVQQHDYGDIQKRAVTVELRFLY
jgi:outer membrane receptor protein involved in Fe transport